MSNMTTIFLVTFIISVVVLGIIIYTQRPKHTH